VGRPGRVDSLAQGTRLFHYPEPSPTSEWLRYVFPYVYPVDAPAPLESRQAGDHHCEIVKARLGTRHCGCGTVYTFRADPGHKLSLECQMAELVRSAGPPRWLELLRGASSCAARAWAAAALIYARSP